MIKANNPHHIIVIHSGDEVRGCCLCRFQIARVTHTPRAVNDKHSVYMSNLRGSILNGIGDSDFCVPQDYLVVIATIAGLGRRRHSPYVISPEPPSLADADDGSVLAPNLDSEEELLLELGRVLVGLKLFFLFQS